MNATVHTAKDWGDNLASYGSGDSAASGGRAGRRAQGRGGRQVAPAGATRALLAAARRQASAPGRGRRSRQSLLAEIQAAATRARGGSRLTNRQVAELRARLAR